MGRFCHQTFIAECNFKLVEYSYFGYNTVSAWMEIQYGQDNCDRTSPVHNLIFQVLRRCILRNFSSTKTAGSLCNVVSPTVSHFEYLSDAVDDTSRFNHPVVLLRCPFVP